ncbi:helix-turn-helix domain-containing protein [Calidithermus roseus]|uniref:Helix-turn-helix domain protein n=1 Tax=Calidithermus roseus TaxID=1644118 RepID=A0A399EZL4_9DEIN|nr:helix-turn-helix domain-containing protein [Calidithermus roseus]RIH88846.1 Helix-turn-helix domain protein [Calidithermus roseus]
MERKELLTVEGIRKEYGMGRETAYRLMKRLPHIRVGQVMMMRRSDLEEYLAKAARERRDIRADLEPNKNPAGAGGER